MTEQTDKLFDPDAQFSLSWTPPRYPALRPDETGVWVSVLENDEPIGIVWFMSTSPAGMGVIWVRQTDAINAIRKHIVEAVQAGTPAAMAYNIVSILPGVKLGSEQRGMLSEVNDDIDSMGE